MKAKNEIQLEKQVKVISNQLEIQRKNAYKDISLWLKKGTNTVPTWMYSNNEFITALKNIKTTMQYINMINKFGRHFIVNQAQCSTILNAVNLPEEEITKIKSVITNFWSQSTTTEFFRRENWGGFLQIESSLRLADDHPILYDIENIV